MADRQCPTGFRWSDELKVCVQEAVTVRQKGGSHFFRNVMLFLIGFAFGFFSLWQFGIIMLIGFGLLLAVLFFMDSRPFIYPVVGFIIGFIAIYWSQISGVLHFLGGLAGG